VATHEQKLRSVKFRCSWEYQGVKSSEGKWQRQDWTERQKWSQGPEVALPHLVTLFIILPFLHPLLLTDLLISVLGYLSAKQSHKAHGLRAFHASLGVCPASSQIVLQKWTNYFISLFSKYDGVKVQEVWCWFLFGRQVNQNWVPKTMRASPPKVQGHISNYGADPQLGHRLQHSQKNRGSNKLLWEGNWARGLGTGMSSEGKWGRWRLAASSFLFVTS
jgi:hypothetical protein